MPNQEICAVFVGSLLLCACHKAVPPGGEASPVAHAQQNREEGVTLTPEQVEKLGVVAQAAAATEYLQETAGFGVVVNHETLAQAAADLATAQAAVRLSRSALARAQRLSGTPGAVSADVEEAAAQKAAVDAAALTLSTRRLSSMLGMNPPWKDGGNDNILQDLAAGRIKLLRVTFPLGALRGGTPASLRAAHLGGNKPGMDWKVTVVWDAPADASVPGRSFFALLKGSDAGEGERLQVWAPIGKPLAGVVIPAPAAVMSEGKFWCYVEHKPGTYARIEIDATRPTPDGYFVTDGLGAGDKVVTASAGRLLAQESAADSAAD